MFEGERSRGPVQDIEINPIRQRIFLYTNIGIIERKKRIHVDMGALLDDMWFDK